MTTPILLTPDEVADMLRIGRSHAYNLLRSRAIPTVHLGRSLRVRRVDLEAWLASKVEYQGDFDDEGSDGGRDETPGASGQE
jgi:excisionase family DNA binding protein